MSDPSWQGRISQIGADGYVTAEEVLTLRRAIFKDGIVSTAELDALFALGERAPDGDREWADFFEEAAADYYLREEEPHGYLTAEEFTSLKARVTRDNCRASALETRLLVRLLEKARQTPPEMTDFVGEQIKAGIMNKPQGACVEKHDAELMRRYLFAAGGAGNVAVTRKEAELLFDINDAAANAPNNPAWTELFIQGVISHLMAHLGYTAPSREEAFRRNAWARDTSSDVGGFFRRMVEGGLEGFKTAFAKEKSFRAEYEEKRAREVEAAAAVTEDEAGWLAGRIGRDGAFDANERKLVERMRELEEDLPDALKALIHRAA